MERPFRVEEILLGDVAGEVSGTVTIDPWWGVIEAVRAQAFEFAQRHTGVPVELDSAARRLAMEIVEASLNHEPDVVDSSGLLVLSGRRTSLRLGGRARLDSRSLAERTLAECLASPKPALRRSIRRAE